MKQQYNPFQLFVWRIIGVLLNKHPDAGGLAVSLSLGWIDKPPKGSDDDVKILDCFGIMQPVPDDDGVWRGCREIPYDIRKCIASFIGDTGNDDVHMLWPHQWNHYYDIGCDYETNNDS
jgi:hypothetical protein